MKLKEKIALEKVFEKEYKIKLIEPENNNEAIITHFLYNNNEAFRNNLGVPFGRAFRSNLFVRSSQKGFPLQSLTQNAA